MSHLAEQNFFWLVMNATGYYPGPATPTAADRDSLALFLLFYGNHIELILQGKLPHSTASTMRRRYPRSRTFFGNFGLNQEVSAYGSISKNFPLIKA